MTVILFAWAVVAIHGNQYGSATATKYDWRPLGEFASPTDCERAATALDLKVYRCISTGKPTGAPK